MTGIDVAVGYANLSASDGLASEFEFYCGGSLHRMKNPLFASNVGLDKPLTVLNASAGNWWYPELGDEVVAVSEDPEDGPTLVRGHIMRFTTARDAHAGIPWNATVVETAIGEPMVATAFGIKRGTPLACCTVMHSMVHSSLWRVCVCV
jgi:hypothetical protein